MSQSYSNPKVGRFLKHGVFYSDPGVICGGLIRFLFSNMILNIRNLKRTFDKHARMLQSNYIFGSRPSGHYFRSVCLSVCLFVQSFSQLSLIRFRSNLDICYMSGSSCVP